MQYEAKTPEEFLELIEDDWRKQKLLEIRQIILEYDPKLEEGIEYKMLCYGKNTKKLFHLNAQKSHVGLYVGNLDKIENYKVLLKDFDYGKGCIRVKKSNKLNETGLEEFIKKTIDTWIQ